MKWASTNVLRYQAWNDRPDLRQMNKQMFEGLLRGMREAGAILRGHEEAFTAGHRPKTIWPR